MFLMPVKVFYFMIENWPNVKDKTSHYGTLIKQVVQT